MRTSYRRACFVLAVTIIASHALAEEAGKRYDPETGRYVAVETPQAPLAAPAAAETPPMPPAAPAAAETPPMPPAAPAAAEAPSMPPAAPAAAEAPTMPPAAPAAAGEKPDAEAALLEGAGAAVPVASQAQASVPSGADATEGFEEARATPLFKEIAAKFKDFTEKELFMIINRCVLTPDHLRDCREFSCTQRETPDLQTDRTRQVIGSYDGKCYYRETSMKEGKNKVVECELTREQQKTLADEISTDLQRLVKADVLLESGRRDAAKSVYASCVEHEGDAGVLLEAKKSGDDQIARIRQAYKDKLSGLKTEEEKAEVIEAIRSYQFNQGKREELRKEIMDSTRSNDVPTPEAIGRELSKQFPVPPKAAPRNLEQMEQEDLALAASLEQLDLAEKSLSADHKMPADLRAATNSVRDKMRLERNKRTDPDSFIINHATPPGPTPAELSALNGGEPGQTPGAEGPAQQKFTLSIKSAGKGAALSAVPGGGREPLQKRLYEAFDALMRGQLSASVERYKSLLQDYPNNVDVLFGLASAYHKLGQKGQARPYYQRAVQLDPDRADLMNNFLALLAEESPENALIELKKLQQISPDFSPVPAQIGLIYFQMKDYRSAAEAFGRAVQLNNENPHYLYNYAVALDKLTRKEEATYYYRKFLRNSMDDPPAANVSRDDVTRRISFLELNSDTLKRAARVSAAAEQAAEQAVEQPAPVPVPAPSAAFMKNAARAEIPVDRRPSPVRKEESLSVPDFAGLKRGVPNAGDAQPVQAAAAPFAETSAEASGTAAQPGRASPGAPLAVAESLGRANAPSAPAPSAAPISAVPPALVSPAPIANPAPVANAVAPVNPVPVDASVSTGTVPAPPPGMPTFAIGSGSPVPSVALEAAAPPAP